MDKVNPKHYNKYEYQPISFIKNFVPDNDSYLVGQVVKYLSRHVDKDEVTDLKKAMFYLERVTSFKRDYPCERFINQIGILEGLIILSINSGNIELAKETLQMYIDNYEELKPLSNKMSWVFLCHQTDGYRFLYLKDMNIDYIKGDNYSLIKSGTVFDI